MRRTIRVGKSNGTVLEDLGVVPDELHRMTRDDLMQGNVDLLDVAGEILSALPTRRLDVSISQDSETEMTLHTSGVDRVDFYSDERPLGSIDVSDGTTELTIDTDGIGTIEFKGFSDDVIVALRREQLA